MRLIPVAIVVLVSLSAQLDASEVKDGLVGNWTLEMVEVPNDSGESAPCVETTEMSLRWADSKTLHNRSLTRRCNRPAPGCELAKKADSARG